MLGYLDSTWVTHNLHRVRQIELVTPTTLFSVGSLYISHTHTI